MFQIPDPVPYDFDPDPDPSLTSMDPARILLSSSKNSKRNLDFYCFETFNRGFIVILFPIADPHHFHANPDPPFP